MKLNRRAFVKLGALFVPGAAMGQVLIPNNHRRALRSALISYWALDDQSNAVRADWNGRNNLTDLGGNITQGNNGIIRFCAVTPAANGQGLSINHNTDVSVNAGDSISFSMWFKAVNNTDVNRGILSKFSTTTEYLLWSDTSHNLVWQVTNLASATVALTVKASPYAQGVWTHVAMGYDNAAQQLWCQYNNGTRQTIACVGVKVNNAAPFQLGNYASNQPFNGSLDEVGLWKRLLTTQDVNDLWNSGLGLQLF